MTKFSNKNLLVISLLFLVFLLPFLAMRNFSPAYDEITHLPSGFSYLKTGELKLNPEHPPLVKMLAAVPLLFLHLKFDSNDPNLIGPKTTEILDGLKHRQETTPRNEWQFGRDLLFNNGTDRVIFWGRIPIILLSVLLGWYVFKWGKELFGYKAGIIGLFIYALMPNIIAHSQFVTMDLGVTAFSFIAVYHLWKFTQEANRKNVILSGLTLGLALGSKFSAVLLLPMSLILLSIYIQKNYSKLNLTAKISALSKIIIPMWGLAFLVIWGLYLFPKDLLFYWHGMGTVYANKNPEHFYYLNGNFDRSGWWYYFLWAFMIKTPVPFLIVLFWALIRPVRGKTPLVASADHALGAGRTSNGMNNAFILLPVILFLWITSWKAHDIGVRYILPIYPFLILYVSGYLSTLIQNAKIKNQNYNLKFKILILILAGWYVFSSTNVYPDYLPYFNELVGGSNNGYKHLDDSNIEWGHDLKRLKAYQDKYPELKVFLWVKEDAQRSYGIRNILPLDFKGDWLLPKGRYAVSTHVLIRTKLASRVYGKEILNWMDNYKPVDRIGQSFFVYEFP